MPISSRIRYVNKRFTNRLMIRIAGKAHSPIALLHHTGRKSGKGYAIPIMTQPDGERFIFALTYGPQVDWYQNVLAAGSCELTYNGQTYSLSNPRMICAEVGRQAFGQVKGTILRWLKVGDFFCMDGEKIAKSDS